MDRSFVVVDLSTSSGVLDRIGLGLHLVPTLLYSPDSGACSTGIEVDYWLFYPLLIEKRCFM